MKLGEGHLGPPLLVSALLGLGSPSMKRCHERAKPLTGVVMSLNSQLTTVEKLAVVALVDSVGFTPLQAFKRVASEVGIHLPPIYDRFPQTFYSVLLRSLQRSVAKVQ
jgi:hypothetical protein